MIVSVITPDESLKKVIESDLIGIDSEVIIANWKEGFEQSTGQFIYFLEKDSDYRGGLFVRGLINMILKSSYRKLAMISPAIEELDRDRTVWGLKCHPIASMVTEQHGDSAYAIQVGYVPGSIIRRSAIEDKGLSFTGSLLQNSINFSLRLWQGGLRIHLDPHMVYQIGKIDSKVTKPIIIPEVVEQIWRQEGI